MTILINNEQTLFPVDEAFLERTALKALEVHGGVENAQVGITLVDDDAIHDLNLRFRQVDRATDVLSFPMIDYGTDYEEGEDPWETDDALKLDIDPLTGEVLLGDLVISIPTARRQAALYGHTPERELAYLTVHGMLHLLGYDHEVDADRVLMRSMEETILDALGLPRTAVLTEGLLTALEEAALASAAPVGAAVLGTDGESRAASAASADEAIPAVLASLPAGVTPQVLTCTGLPEKAALPCPAYCLADGLWMLKEPSAGEGV